MAKSEIGFNRQLISNNNNLNKLIDKVKWDDALEELITFQMTMLHKTT